MRGSDELTREGLAAFLELFDPDPEKAAVRYEEIRRRLVRHFAWKGWKETWPSAEDLADRTVNRVARKRAEGVEIRNPYSYVLGVAKLIRQEALRELLQETPPPEPPPRDPPPPEEEGLLEALQHCLGRLLRKERDLFERYYLAEDRIEARKQLALELKIDMNALRIRVHRIRRRVETCIQETLGPRNGSGPGDTQG